MTSQAVNKRAEERVQAEETIFIEMLASMDHSHDSVTMCSSVDLSNSGLQVLIDEDIPIGSILRLCIDLKDDAPIFLVAEVMWHRPDPETGGFRMGFRIFDSEDTDSERWHTYIRALT